MYNSLKMSQTFVVLSDSDTDDSSLYDDSGINTGMEAQNNQLQVFLRIKDGVFEEQLYEVNDKNLICKVPAGSNALRNLKVGEKMTKTYSFTTIFGPETRQIEIFNDVVKGKILGFINGQNSSLLTYGASGSGKTFTIMGTAEEPGLIPRSLEYIFRTVPNLTEPPRVMPLANGDVKYLDETSNTVEKLQKSVILNATHVERSIHIKTYKQMQQRLSSEVVGQVDEFSEVSVSLWVSFAEIYNEDIYDLLKAPPPKGKQRPKLRLGNSNGSCYIKDLTSVHVSSGIEAYQILQYGIHNLNYAATTINSHSSRSHCVFTLKLIQSNDAENGVCMSTFNFCDLAGSERVKKSLSDGDRLKETNNINTSLLVLGRCISNIKSSQQSKDNRPVPFRESKLTQLFQRALTGLEDIAMIINMNSSRDMFDETQHVLNFSALAKHIQIEKQPKFVKPKKPNRFSNYMERRTCSGQRDDKDDEKDVEIQNLKQMVTQLYTEIEHQKEEHRVEIELERNHIISGYRQIIKDISKANEEEKARTIDRLKRGYEQKMQGLNDHYSKLLHDKSDIISIDSSSGEEEEAVPQSPMQKIRELECIIAKQKEKIKSLQEELCEVKVDRDWLQNENQIIPVIKEQLKISQEVEIDLKATLCSAEDEYLALQNELREVEIKNDKLNSEKLLLEEKVENLEELLSRKSDDTDEVENSEMCNNN